MKFYQKDTSEIREIDETLYQKWVTDGNPKAGYFAPLPPEPTYDLTTQKPPVFADGVWIVPLKSAEELQADADAVADRSEEILLRAAVSALKAGTGTAGERLIRLERVAVYLLRHSLVILFLLLAPAAAAQEPPPGPPRMRTTLRLVWDKPVEEQVARIVGYRVYRKTVTPTGPAYSRVLELPQVYEHPVTGLAPGTYVLTCYNAEEESDYSTEATIIGPLGIVTGLRVVITLEQ